jgi:cellulose synthase/poly-beta-1,6-N-acetylglucosamine synthase-like glycosyltransferase
MVRGGERDAGAASGWGAWWGRHPSALHLLATVALCWSTVYVAWRVGWSWRGSEPLLWGALLATELYGLWNLAMLAWLTWEVKAPKRPCATPGRAVDIYICTYDEPASLLEATLAGCAKISYPHTTWLLDDGARPEIRALAREWGAHHMTRPDKSHAKAGNINHALPITRGELVLVLDADHVPLPDALDTLVGYFDDPKVALVQTPHDFSNHDSIQHYDLGRHEQSVFFSAICPGKDRHNASFWCGSGALIRRDALLSVGGVATETIAEDFHTTIKLHREGWRTRYDDRVVVQGRAPHDLASYLLQRDRWARGNLSVFATPESPLRVRGLTPSQRLSYFASLTAYLAGPVRLVVLCVLAGVLWTGALPLQISPTALASLWAPATILMLLAGSALSRGQQSIGETTHYELCTAEIFARALRCAVRPGRTTFKVTPKEGVDHGGREALRQFPLLIGIAIVLALGMLLRLATDTGLDVLPPMKGFAALFVPLLGLLELRRLMRTLSLVGRRRQLRGDYRVPLTAAAVVVAHEQAEDGDQGDGVQPHTMLARMQDITPSGAGFEISRRIEPGTRVDLAVALPGLESRFAHHSTETASAPVRLESVVRSCLPSDRGWRIGVGIVRCGRGDRRRILEYCSVTWPFHRLRGDDEPAPRAIAGLSRREALIQAPDGLLDRAI